MQIIRLAPILLIFFINCQEKASKEHYQSKINLNTNFNLSQQHSKDSLVIVYTIQQWIDRKCGPFKAYNIKEDTSAIHNKIYVDTIFYDATMKKFLSFVHIKYSKDYIDTFYFDKSRLSDYYFDSYVVVGYKESNDSTWRIIELDEIFKGIMSPSLQSANEMLGNVYLNKQKMLDTYVSVYDNKGEHKLEAVKYIPTENEFWTLSPIWKKGNRVPGYYLFETYMNATPLNKQIRPVCIVRYPDSLLNN